MGIPAPTAIPVASTVVVSHGPDGEIFVELHDRAGRLVAVAPLGLGRAVAFAVSLNEACQALIDADCEPGGDARGAEGGTPDRDEGGPS